MSASLSNPKREAFARAYAGQHWGNATAAYIAAGYSRRSARQGAGRMLTSVDIAARVAVLREERLAALAVDRAWVLEQRLAIAQDPDASNADRLKALDAIERSMGMAAPERVQVEHSGSTDHHHAITVSADGWAALREYVSGILSP